MPEQILHPLAVDLHACNQNHRTFSSGNPSIIRKTFHWSSHVKPYKKLAFLQYWARVSKKTLCNAQMRLLLSLLYLPGLKCMSRILCLWPILTSSRTAKPCEKWIHNRNLPRTRKNTCSLQDMPRLTCSPRTCIRIINRRPSSIPFSRRRSSRRLRTRRNSVRPWRMRRPRVARRWVVLSSFCSFFLLVRSSTATDTTGLHTTWCHWSFRTQTTRRAAAPEQKRSWTMRSREARQRRRSKGHACLH